jgi:hypothetical protein
MLEIEDYCIDFCYLVDCREIILSSIGFFLVMCVCVCVFVVSSAIKIRSIHGPM